jgi:hypothetical protein
MNAGNGSGPPKISARGLSLGVLAFLSERGSSNKWNMLGKPLQPGDIEGFLGLQFDEETRARCARAIDVLHRADLIRADYGNLSDPDAWVDVTERGRQALTSGALDALDEELLAIAPHLVDMRAGAWDALASQGSDSLRQAADSAWELLSQAIKLAVSDEDVKAAEWFSPNLESENGVTRAHRARLIMERRFGRADEDACEIVSSAARRLGKLKHARENLEHGQVQLAMRQAEDALRVVLVPHERQGR